MSDSSATGINFLLSIEVCEPGAAPVLSTSFVTGDKFINSYFNCTAKRIMLTKLCSWPPSPENFTQSFIMEPNKEFETVEIFSGFDWQAEMVKDLLENEEVHCYIKDSIIGTIAPWVIGKPGSGSVTVVTSSLDLEKARMIVEEYERNFQGE
jgi:hypothetical protein